MNDIQFLFPAQKIADWFNAWAEHKEVGLTRLGLQKLLYFSQAHYLSDKDMALFNEEIQAWEHGPVVYEVWAKENAASEKDDKKLAPLNYDFDFNDFEPELNSFLIKIWNTYAKANFDIKNNQVNAIYLERKTHKEATWRTHWNEVTRNEIIPKDYLRNYYVFRELVTLDS